MGNFYKNPEVDWDVQEVSEACEQGDAFKVKHILDKGQLDINRQYFASKTFLHNSMEHNRHNVVSTLLSYPHLQLDVTEGSCGRTPLHEACLYNSPTVIPLFCADRRCNPGIVNARSERGETALMVAVTEGHLDCVQEMAKIKEVDVSIKNNDGKTPMEVAKETNHKQIVECLEKIFSSAKTQQVFYNLF